MLTKAEAQAMTVNERLASVGLLVAFDDAVARRDVAQLQGILERVYLSPSEATAIIEQVLRPGWAVRTQLVRSFGLKPVAWTRANELLRKLGGVPSQGTDTPLDLARLQMAVLKLAAADLGRLEHWSRQAALDARSVLAAAGLDRANWKQVLARQGLAVPGGIEGEP